MSAVTRQFPNPVELLELMQFKRPDFNGRRRRLNAALTIADLRDIAKRRTRPPPSTTPTAPRTAKRASPAPAGVRRRRVPPVDPARRLARRHVVRDLRRPVGPAFGIAPTGFTRLMQTEGEIAGAGAAGAAGIPFTLSTLGTSSIESVQQAIRTGATGSSCT